MYAELVSDPLVVYKYLEANNIGQKQAAFYEEYAEYLEKKKMWHEAELYYKLGINRSAQPLTRIKEKFSLFRARMFLAGVTPSESDLVVDISDAMKKKDVNKPLLVEQQPIVRQFGRGVLSEQIAPLNYQPASSVHHEPANIANESGKRRLQVYVDQENIPPPDTTTAAAAVDGENQAPWDDLGTEAGRIKENEAAFDSWRKPLKMGPVPPKKFTKFKVYEDEQDTLDEAPKTPSHDIPTRSQKEDSPSQSTLLKRDPLHYIHSEDAADKEAKAAVKPPTERKAEVASKREIIVANMEL
ncbi:hypothetical protein BDF22DRAFT_145908 [Syncephalis plumigaleata]|nr:hypothetical protein BDF22DRAFT_145908 [Syncephalis plumigaleata]